MSKSITHLSKTQLDLIVLRFCRRKNRNKKNRNNQEPRRPKKVGGGVDDDDDDDDLSLKPFLFRIPRTGFGCKARAPGYYADMDADCRVNDFAT